MTYPTVTERAAREVEAAPSYLSVETIAEIISGSETPDAEDRNRAQALVEGLAPLFAHVASRIRALVPLEENLLIDATLERVRVEAHKLIENPYKKPRKSEPVVRRGLWWKDLEATLTRLQADPQTLEAHDAVLYDAGFTTAVQKASARLKGMDAFVKDAQGHPRARKPEDFAAAVETLKP